MKLHLTKICFLFGLLQFSSILIAQTPCEGNTADGFPCADYGIQDILTNAEMGTDFTNDSWGWTDPETGKEYAIIGVRNGTVFADISTPSDIVYLGKLPTHTTSSLWRDIKVSNNYAFIVSEAGGHGMQVFDLTRLRDVPNPPETFTEDAHYNQFGNAHNIVINENSANEDGVFAYAVGTSTFSGGAHFIDITDPLNPTPAGGYATNGYTHDAQVVTYNGPDPDYIGREIYIGSNLNIVAIADVTDKDNPTEIATMTYNGISDAHQGWFTEDHRFFILGDETDEIFSGFNTRTIIFDMEDLDNPTVHFEYFSTNPSTDHNGYVVGNTFYLASYRAGMRVIDISDIANQNINEIGFFDTVPNTNSVGTGGGVWNVYPFFESGNIILSDQNQGLVLVASNDVLSTESFENQLDVTMFPNPSSGIVTINTNTPVGQIAIYNTLGQVVHTTKSTTTDTQLDLTHLQTGLYFVKTANSTQKLILK
ncbi:choice-of-anchor B family protein [uncultured Dokdonia sp.]|uniref:choice-of-anchor B family protein n=1 Tax=uncultured Dokdonia sp. TaxID=575653 RepID=UPI002623F7A6|nr:choice-of-anchor B family protein [uncultured Dokdonia sp.]